MKSHIIINNFFNNPKDVKNFALKQKFYTKENHPHKKILGEFPGYRTDFINNLNKKVYEKIRNILLSALQIYLEDTDIKIDFLISFSYTSDEVKMPMWCQNDKKEKKYKTKVAGVVYLNEETDVNSGTMIIVNNKGYNCSNEYNKLFMYNTDIMHSAAGSFGKHKFDSRLVLTFLASIK
jgi:hypothetical protein